MKADEIIKILRGCGNGMNTCVECSYYREKDPHECKFKAMYAAANLIKAQQQEIDQLKAENDHWQEICADLHIEYGDEIDQLKAQAAELHEALKWLKAISFSHEDDLTQWPAQDTREEVEHALSLGAGCDYHNPADTERIKNMETGLRNAQSLLNNVEYLIQHPLQVVVTLSEINELLGGAEDANAD